MTRRTVLTGSVALMILMGTLLLAAPAHAVIQDCEGYQSGTQAYAECMVRAEDREAAPILPPADVPEGSGSSTVVETTSTELWQLAVAGLIGALLAIGATLGVGRLGHREGVAAH